MQDRKKEFKKLLGNLIREKRSEANKSISLVSDEIDLSKSVWFEIENGNRDPQITTMWRISEALNIPLSEFIKGIENKIGTNYFIDN